MGQGFTLLIDQLFSRLFSPRNGHDGVRVGSGVAIGKREGVIVQGQTLFKTISSALGWVKLMPVAERYCLLNKSYRTLNLVINRIGW